MATKDNLNIGGMKTRMRGDFSNKDVAELEKGNSNRFEANEKKKKDK